MSDYILVHTVLLNNNIWMPITKIITIIDNPHIKKAFMLMSTYLYKGYIFNDTQNVFW